jgi:PHD/YefM family antitoxin component YafN of YafNO toxin-antitoxin module
MATMATEICKTSNNGESAIMTKKEKYEYLMQLAEVNHELVR